MSSSRRLAVTTRSAAQRERDPLLDNAKFVAIVLVVVGHVWTQLRVVPAVDAAYTFLYLFHIPVFVLLAGFLSRNFRLSIDSVYKLAVSLLIPYVLFETFYERLAAWVDGHHVHHNAIAPSWVMWFLIALFMWRLSVPMWRRLGAPLAITAAIAVSVWGGMSTNDDYAWSKTVSLLPFFVIGMFVRREHFDRLRTAGVRLVALGLAITTALACLLSGDSFNLGLARWKYSYAELGFGVVDGAAVRLIAIAGALVLAAAFIALVPGGRSRFTAWGANTMYAYLLHGAVIQLALVAGAFTADWATTLGGVALITAAAAVVGCLLTAPAVKRVLRPGIEPGPTRRAYGSTEPEASEELEALWRLPSATQRPIAHSRMR